MASASEQEIPSEPEESGIQHQHPPTPAPERGRGWAAHWSSREVLQWGAKTAFIRRWAESLRLLQERRAREETAAGEVAGAAVVAAADARGAGSGRMVVYLGGGCWFWNSSAYRRVVKGVRPFSKEISPVVHLYK
jgi:hypothetical protein